MSEGCRDDGGRCAVHAGETRLSREGGRTDDCEHEDGIRRYLEGTRVQALSRVRSGSGDGSGSSGARVYSLLGLLRRAGQGSHEDAVTQEEAWWLECGEELGGPACCGEVRRAVSGGPLSIQHGRLASPAGTGSRCPAPGVYILSIPLASYL